LLNQKKNNPEIYLFFFENSMGTVMPVDRPWTTRGTTYSGRGTTYSGRGTTYLGHGHPPQKKTSFVGILIVRLIMFYY
jgi:hypothetical protein